ncbi:MAG: hypothetical protein ABJB47_22790, partial [Actinomycetota bacterium]
AEPDSTDEAPRVAGAVLAGQAEPDEATEPDESTESDKAAEPAAADPAPVESAAAADAASGDPAPVGDDAAPVALQGTAVQRPERGEVAPVAPVAMVHWAGPDLSPPVPAVHLDEAPSWGAVLRTTVRLWLERRGLRQSASSVGPRSRWRTVALLGLVIVIFAAGALTVGLIWRSSLNPARHEPAAQGTGAAAAAAVRTDAAQWIAEQVSPGAIVSCDPVMCAALEAQHFPAGSLLTLGPLAVDPLGSAIVVATAAVRSDFGSRLTSEYAPVPIAAFGSGAAGIEVRVVATGGAPSYLRALRQDQEARRQTGAQLARNPFIRASSAARTDLTQGRVDSRLMATLVLLSGQQVAGQHGVQVLTFGSATPGADPAVPLRSAQLVAPPQAGPGYLTDLRSLLRQQIAPYLASSITITKLHDGRTVLLVGFTAPGQLGMLGSPAATAPASAPAKIPGKKHTQHKAHSSHKG